MDTKLKGWTAVRIICFILITVLCFTAINRALTSLVRAQETNIMPDIVLVDLTTNDYFFSKNMSSAQHHASIIAYFGSEESIIAGDHLMWSERNDMVLFHNEFGGYYVPERRSILQTPDGLFYYSDIERHEYTVLEEANRYRFEHDAKRQQLSVFYNSLDALNSMDGLLYYISVDIPDVTYGIRGSVQIIFPDEDASGIFRSSEELYEASLNNQNTTTSNSEQNVIYSNIGFERQSNQHIKSQPVYYIWTADNRIEQSLPGYSDTAYANWPASHINTGQISLAFTERAVKTQNAAFASTRTGYIIDLSIIVASAVLVLGMVIILIIGAGRQNVLINGVKTRSNDIRFSISDKPYLDIGLALLICWVVAVAFFSFKITGVLWEYHLSVPATNIIFAAATVFIVPPALLWFMNLVKRIKAGGFWRHTLIYAILYSFLFGSLRFLVRKIISLWAGTRLTFKVAIISFTSFCVMFFVGILGVQSNDGLPVLIIALAFMVPVAVLLLLFARRLRSLEHGARCASEGDYDVPIEAGGGELGSIAQSINNISAGINTAVEDRMKSERLKTELITNVSHDIRTPLTSIITYTDLLDHEGLDCERAPEYLDVLKQKSLRLKTLTEELFEAAKAATGNIDVNLTDLNIVSLMNQVLGELDNSIKSSGLDLRVNLPDKLYARADGRLMQRIMENLLSNVFKYSQPSSRVYLDAMQADYESVKIELKNISAQELNFDPSELTERFKRGDESRADGGSGLGLSIVQSFVSAQGGKFEIKIDGDLFKAAVILPVPPPQPVIKG